MYRENLSNRIANLKIHSGYSDSPALRMSMKKTFSLLDITPPGMSPSAILIVRNINAEISADCLHELNNKSVIPLINKHLIDDWKLTIERQVEELYRDAVKPVNSIAGHKEKAVLFNDEAELLACFCREIVRGDGTDKWWWRRYFSYPVKQNTSSELITRQLVQKPSYVPAVINLLAKWNMAISFVKSLETSDCYKITQSMLYEYGLIDLGGKLHRTENQSNEAYSLIHEQQTSNENEQQFFKRSESIYSEKLNDHGQGYRFKHGITLPPWFDLFNAEIWRPDLNKEQITLLGISRLLQEKPVLIRSNRYQEQICYWYLNKEATNENNAFLQLPQNQGSQEDAFFKNQYNVIEKNGEHESNIYFDQTDKNNILTVEGINKNSAEVSSHFQADINSASHEENLNLDIQNEILSSNDQSAFANTDQDNEFKIENDTKIQPGNLSDIKEASEKEEINQQTGDKLQPASGQESISLTGFTTEVGEEYLDFDKLYSDNFFDSQLGGLLYVINLLSQLNFPVCISKQLNIDQQISRWAFLDAISRALLGKKYFSLSKDPIWKILAVLDRRKLKVPLGKGFQEQADYFIPVDWFAYFAEDSKQQYYWAVHKNRLRIWTDTAIISEHDISSIDSAENRVLSVLKEYSAGICSSQIQHDRFGHAPLANRKQLKDAGIDQGLAYLISFVLPFLRHYLHNILSLSSVTPHVLLKEFLKLDSRIFISSSHIDLVADINKTSLTARRSGLDQDPGWLPEYGRVVLFHFDKG